MVSLFFGVFIFVALNENSLILGYQAGSLIWNRNRKVFIPIASISTFKAEQMDIVNNSRELEVHNFQNSILRVAYFEEPNIVNFYDDNTKITGVCGELWNIMSEYLNFTMVTIKVEDSHFGELQANGSYNGLLGMITRDEIDIIPRTGCYVAESKVLAYTVPVWNDRYRLFIRPEIVTDTTWMFNMFSQQVWWSILVIFIFMSVLGYTIQKISFKISGDKHVRHTLDDHFFYTFGTLCCQGFIPDSLYHRTKVIGLTKKIFSWLLLIMMSSHLISYMTDQKVQPPFEDIESMFNSTTYQLIVYDGAMVYPKVKIITKKLMETTSYQKRLLSVQNPEKLYEKGCWGNEKFAILESDDKQRAYGRFQCYLVPTGRSYFATWIAAGVSKTFKYKRALDMGILKLSESGLTDGLMDRWLAINTIKIEEKVVTSVNFDQIFVLLTVLFIGMTTAFGILIIECAVSLYHSNRRKIRERQRQLYFSRRKGIS